MPILSDGLITVNKHSDKSFEYVPRYALLLTIRFVKDEMRRSRPTFELFDVFLEIRLTSPFLLEVFLCNRTISSIQKWSLTYSVYRVREGQNVMEDLSSVNRSDVKSTHSWPKETKKVVPWVTKCCVTKPLLKGGKCSTLPLLFSRITWQSSFESATDWWIKQLMTHFFQA